MTGSGRVLYDVRERIARLTLNRPEKLNALDRGTLEEIDHAVASAGEDPGVGVLVVTGAGEKAFAAGADIGELAAQTPVGGVEHARFGQGVFGRLENLGKPSIASINGYALGGGLELALACTLRVAAETARLGLPETSLAIIPGYGGTQRLSRLVGRGKALEMILTGEPIPATEAHRIGLVNRVVPGGELAATVDSLAGTLLARGPLALRFAMQAIREGMEMPQAEGLFLESTLFGLTCTTDDMREGTTSFLEKRKAVFKGK